MNKKDQEILFRIESKVDKILSYIQEEDELQRLDHILISCDASIKENPGGPASIGYIIRRPGLKPLEVSKLTNATTSNQAEYDAIYEALLTLCNLVNNPTVSIEIRSDSQLVVNQLNGDYKCEDPILQKRNNCILELIRSIPTPISLVWRPRNSTRDLKQVNFAAQNLLNVKPH